MPLGGLLPYGPNAGGGGDLRKRLMQQSLFKQMLGGSAVRPFPLYGASRPNRLGPVGMPGGGFGAGAFDAQGAFQEQLQAASGSFLGRGGGFQAPVTINRGGITSTGGPGRVGKRPITAGHLGGPRAAMFAKNPALKQMMMVKDANTTRWDLHQGGRGGRSQGVGGPRRGSGGYSKGVGGPRIGGRKPSLAEGGPRRLTDYVPKPGAGAAGVRKAYAMKKSGSRMPKSIARLPKLGSRRAKRHPVMNRRAAAKRGIRQAATKAVQSASFRPRGQTPPISRRPITTRPQASSGRILVKDRPRTRPKPRHAVIKQRTRIPMGVARAEGTGVSRNASRNLSMPSLNRSARWI